MFSPDGRTLVTGSADHTVRRWDVALPAPHRSDQQDLPRCRPRPQLAGIRGVLAGPATTNHVPRMSPDRHTNDPRTSDRGTQPGLQFTVDMLRPKDRAMPHRLKEAPVIKR
ncbi:hypothetical protein ACQEV2_41495 [Streptomyces sp. CA-251387]|uniref:hypothetical protein n=1 Tax=Streptomyces sp. CA-251387 TaxID=3240064 RepID=UPI003D8A1C3B